MLLIYRGRGRVMEGGCKGKGMVIRMPGFIIESVKMMRVDKESILSIFD